MSQPTLEQWLARGRTQKKRKRLSPLSKKREKRLTEYKKVERAHLKDNPSCQVGAIIKGAGYEVDCRGMATHCHHVRGRIGPLLLDRRHLLSSCDGECHPFWVHQKHVDLAHNLGLLE